MKYQLYKYIVIIVEYFADLLNHIASNMEMWINKTGDRLFGSYTVDLWTDNSIRVEIDSSGHCWYEDDSGDWGLHRCNYQWLIEHHAEQLQLAHLPGFNMLVTFHKTGYNINISRYTFDDDKAEQRAPTLCGSYTSPIYVPTQANLAKLVLYHEKDADIWFSEFNLENQRLYLKEACHNFKLNHKDVCHALKL